MGPNEWTHLLGNVVNRQKLTHKGIKKERKTGLQREDLLDFQLEDSPSDDWLGRIQLVRVFKNGES